MAKRRRAGAQKKKKKNPTGVAAQRPYNAADVRALADAVFARHDPADIACELLDGERPMVKQRVWEKLLEYRYGRPRQMIEATGPRGGPVRVQIVSRVLRPKRGTEE